MERWSIELSKEYFHFSAAHFLIFPDGSAERLHGHNYRVYVDIEAELTRFGLVIDFKRVKPVVREIVDELDEHWLVPGEHPELAVDDPEPGVREIRYRERTYRVPAEDVLVLPLNNTSAENFSTFIGRELRRRLAERFVDVDVKELVVGVEETPGQRGIYHYRKGD